jgi:hypothetical protein
VASSTSGSWAQQCALAEVIERERGHHHTEPGQADRCLAEVAQVGVQRLGASHAQHHRAQDDEGGARLGHREAQGVQRVQRLQDAGLAQDLHHPQQRQHCKPHQGDGPEETADTAGAALLHREQGEQDHQRQRNHPALELGRDHLQALHRRQYRDGGCDHAVAVEEAGAEDAHEQQDAAQARLVLDRLRGQGQHGHQAALAVVVRAQHQ